MAAWLWKNKFIYGFQKSADVGIDAHLDYLN